MIAPGILHAQVADSNWITGRQAEGSLSFARERDSLEQILLTADSDEKRVDLLNDFSFNVFNKSYEMALESASKALEMAHRINYIEGKIRAEINIGQVHVNLTQDYALGLKHLNSALGLIEDGKFPRFELTVYRLIGFLTYRQDGLEDGIEYFNKAIEVAQKNAWQNEISDLRAYMGDLYEVAGKTDLAIEEYRQILAQEEKSQFKDAGPAAITAIAHYFYLNEDYRRTEEFFHLALDRFREQGLHRWTAYTLSLLGELQIKLGNPKKGLDYALEGLELARQYKLTKEMGDCHYALVGLYDTLGNVPLSYHHFKEETALNNLMFNSEKTRQIANVQSSYEYKIREQKLEQLTMEKDNELKRGQIIIVAGAGGIVLIGVLLIFLYSAYNQKKKVNAQLSDRVELKDLALSEIVGKLQQEIELHKQTRNQLESTHSELNHFIYKSSHDLKGPLATILGLTDIARRDISTAERLEYLEMIRASSARLSSKLDGLIYATQLTEGPLQVQKVNISDQINEIVDSLQEQDYAAGVQVEIIVPSDLEIHSDRHLSGTLLMSLIENSLQYKDTAKASPFVKIEAKRDGNGVRYAISDNGRGILKGQLDQVFDMFVKSNIDFNNSGLGLYLAKKTALKLGGQISLESQNKVGTTAHIYLPDHGAAKPASSNPHFS